MRGRRLILRIGIAVLFFVSLCEIGALPIRYHGTVARHRVDVDWATTSPKASLRVTYIDESFRRVHRIEGATPDAPIEVTIRLARFELTGPYWVPLWKTGTASWTATIESESGKVSGRFEGELELSVRGLCSARGFRMLAGHAVRRKIREKVSERTRK